MTYLDEAGVVHDLVDVDGHVGVWVVSDAIKCSSNGDGITRTSGTLPPIRI